MRSAPVVLVSRFEDADPVAIEQPGRPEQARILGDGQVAQWFVNSIAVHRKGDAWASHCNPTPSCHASTLAQGSATVFANGKPLARIGDPVACGSSVAAGSANVFAGG